MWQIRNLDGCARDRVNHDGSLLVLVRRESETTPCNGNTDTGGYVFGSLKLLILSYLSTCENWRLNLRVAPDLISQLDVNIRFFLTPSLANINKLTKFRIQR